MGRPAGWVVLLQESLQAAMRGSASPISVAQGVLVVQR